MHGQGTHVRVPSPTLRARLFAIQDPKPFPVHLLHSCAFWSWIHRRRYRNQQKRIQPANSPPAMQAAQGYEDLLHATRAQLETSGQLQKWRQQQQEASNATEPPMLAAIARIEICGKCQGHRLEKVLYQSMVLERTCAQCDGEGVITRHEGGRTNANISSSRDSTKSQAKPPRWRLCEFCAKCIEPLTTDRTENGQKLRLYWFLDSFLFV